MDRKTVIIGASPDPSRYAYLAAQMLKQRGIPFVPVGIKTGEVLGEPILDLKDKPVIDDVHTVTLYIGAHNQRDWYEYILSLNPKRIIFNPGTENFELMKMAGENKIEAFPACSLVLLSSGQF